LNSEEVLITGPAQYTHPVSKADVMTPDARNLGARSLPILKRDSINVIVF
jgi:hypothetical protein